MMLAEWLRPKDLHWFVENNFGKLPYARPSAAMTALPLFEWGTVHRLLQADLPLDLLTVRDGRLMDVPRPRGLGDMLGLIDRGVSVVVRAAEQHDSGVATLAGHFRRVFAGEVHVQLYITPGMTNSYGWHFDFEDVFIVQTVGVKDYFFRANTVSGDAVLGDSLDFNRVRYERSPIFSVRLIPGDWLYIPANWWHLVKCVETALSISVGVMPVEALNNARRVPSGWSSRVAADPAG